MRYLSLKPPAASNSFSMSLILWAAATLSARGIGEIEPSTLPKNREVRSKKDKKVRSTKYEGRSKKPRPVWVLLCPSSFLLPVIRMSLQDGESAIELLQQHHSRQLMR